MIRRTTLLLAALALACTAPAMDRVTADALNQRAGEAYAQGDHATALALYDSVATHWRSAALAFNLGNCHYKLGDVPRAILHYERALILDPGAEDVRANLDLARQQVADRVNELPGFSLGATWGRLRGGRDLDTWARRALWACLITCGVFAAAWWMPSRSLRRITQVLAGLALVTTLGATALSATRATEIRDRSEAIILAPKVEIRSEPNAGATILFVLHKGTKITVLHDGEGWSEVRLPNGHVGWMPGGTFERI